MKELYSKTKLSTIALILVLTISATLVALPAATAQEVEPQSKTTYAFLGAVPNPVGKGQPVLLHVGITDYFDSAEKGWDGLTVSVKDPEGIESTLTIDKTDSTGGTGYLFTPMKVGTYTLQTHFPAQWWNRTTLNFWTMQFETVHMYYESSVSDVVELVVQEDSIPYYPGNKLPSDYWTRPIDSQLREWTTISASWLGTLTNLYAPNNEYAPDTAHILWTKPFTMGGLAGGVGEHSFEAGDAYKGKWTGSMIVAGMLYYQHYSGRQPVVYHCVDLHTGEELWTKTFPSNQTIACAQLMYWSTYNYHGVFAYLWVIETVGGGPFGGGITTWHAFDAYTGDLVYSMTNVPVQMGWFGGFGAGTTIGPKGEILSYNVNTRQGYMTVWNSTNIPALYGSPTTAESYGYGSWMPEGKSVNASGPTPETPTNPFELAGYQANVTIEAGLTGSVQAVLDDRIIGASISQTEVTSWALSIEPDSLGETIYKYTYDAPASYWAAGNVSIGWGAATPNGEDGVFVLWASETRKYYGFSTENGHFLWEAEDSEQYLNYYVGTNRAIAYGRLFSTGVSGTVYCYNITTGDLLWTYEAYDPYQEILWANNWWGIIDFVADGKIYIGHEEHSVIDPKPRGAPYYCLDITDGSEVWRINGAFRQSHWGGNAIIGDSIMATQNTYDQRVYAVGKGATTTTVSIQNDVVSLGSSVMIKGTVMDVSPGTEDAALQIRFPNGVPAISDGDMSEWMQYVYMQFGIPDATGVEVKLEAIDPNGKYFDIGTATTDTSGNYGFTFKPDVEGKYMIMATFYGSGGYYGSTTTTYLAVDPAPEELDIPSAEEIAQETISQLPAYPDVPSATQVAQETISQLPAYPEMPEIPEIPAYLTIDLVIIAAVAIAVIIGIVSYLALRKEK